jgi:succinate-semialdehyde dehydrogenase/glutarate-semialdehyde dehydrogenase
VSKLDEGVDVRNPRSGKIDRGLNAPSAEELVQLTTKLREAQRRWQAAGPGYRAAALLKWHKSMSENRDALVAALTEDTGRVTESHLELQISLDGLARWAGQVEELLNESHEQQTSISKVTVLPSIRPYPLVGIISPWNFPLLLALIDAIPALAAGCAVIIKPSEITPRFLGPLAETLRSVPELSAVVGLIEGAGETGASLIPLVDLVCFTGSVETGQIVAENAARHFIPASLELGGKDPAIVLASADLDRAVPAILWGSTANSGQSCLSIERVYVHESLFDEFVARITPLANKLGLNHPTMESGALGPIIAEDQIATIKSHLEDAYSRGAKATAGGEIKYLDGGAYLEPTVLIDVNHSMKVMTEETFAPIIPIMKFSSDEEAVRLANDTIYGLSAAVFGDEERAKNVGRRIDAGAVSINDAALTGVMHEGEKQAFKLSGIGASRMGKVSIRRFYRRQSLLVNRSTQRDPWWWPDA